MTDEHVADSIFLPLEYVFAALVQGAAGATYASYSEYEAMVDGTDSCRRLTCERVGYHIFLSQRGYLVRHAPAQAFLRDHRMV